MHPFIKVLLIKWTCFVFIQFEYFLIGLPDAPEPVTDIAKLATLSPPPQPSSSTKSDRALSSPSPVNRPRSASSSRTYDPYAEKQKAYMEKMKQIEKTLYNDAVECPICFLV